MERECLRILLRGNQPIIICPARSLDGMKLPHEYKKPLDQGCLLLLSPFPDELRRATVQTITYRNRIVAALADSVLVPYASASSKTLKLCRNVVTWEKPLYTLADAANEELTTLGAKSLKATSAIPNLLSRNLQQQ